MREARLQLGLAKKDATVIGLMPGSRRSEIRHILPIMLQAAANIAKVYPNAAWIPPFSPRNFTSSHQEVPAGIGEHRRAAD